MSVYVYQVDPDRLWARYLIRAAEYGSISARDTVVSVYSVEHAARTPALSGVVVWRGAPGFVCWTMTFPGAAIPGEARCDAPSPAATLELSDVVEGDSGSGVGWVHDTMTTWTSATGTLDRSEPLQIFYQVRSTIMRTGLRTTITVTDITNPRRGRRAVQLELPGDVHPGITDFVRRIDFRGQPPGHYLIELQVGDPEQGGAAVKSRELTLQ